MDLGENEILPMRACGCIVANKNSEVGGECEEMCVLNMVESERRFRVFGGEGGVNGVEY